ncbi:MAG: hypothetical protein HS127_00660 [Planctomycetia bacterium]|nr:hypothetical protein [Planctomycetia bacterium]
MGIEVRYLMSSGVDKEKLARQIAADKRITEGSICLLSVVEPCIAPMVKGNKASKKLELVMAPRKCVFVYHYFNDPVFGLVMFVSRVGRRLIFSFVSMVVIGWAATSEARY